MQICQSPMQVYLIPHSLTSVASTPTHLTFRFSKPFNPTPNTLQISAVTLAPPRVQSTRVKALPRRLLKQRRRTKKISSTAGGDDDGAGEGVFGSYSDDGGDGPFNNNNGGGGGYGGGGNWNFGWDEFFSDDNENNGGYHDPAFDFVYEVLSWIVLSNCLHFALQKFTRIARQKFAALSHKFQGLIF